MSEADQDGPGICPVCRTEDDYRVPTFTFWGGMIGHRVLNHVYCNNCGTGFNVKTGKSNLMRIILYQVVILVVLVPLFMLPMLLLALS